MPAEVAPRSASDDVADSTEGVDVPDDRLRSALERLLGKAPGEAITPTELAGFTTMSLPNAGVMDLTGLEYATGLHTLDLSGNSISDLRPLAGLTSIFHLRLSGNAIADITPLAGLADMRLLFLSHNGITDIAALAGMTYLGTLDIAENSVENIEPLADKTHLATLVLADNSITDIAPLSGMFESRRHLAWPWLDLSGNLIGDLTPLSAMTELRTLNLARNEVSDLTPLAALTELRTLNLARNQFSDLTPLAGLINLRELDLSDNLFSDLSFLATLGSNPYFGGFRTLKLARNSVADLSALEELGRHRPDLRELDLSGNAIRNIEPITALPRLRRLDLSDNRIADVEPLVANPRIDLDYLNLAGNRIEDVTPLTGTTIRELDLSRNTITDGAQFVGFDYHLTLLDLSFNSLADFPSFSTAAFGFALERLDVSHNAIDRIPDPPPFVSVQRLNLAHNPLNDITSLQPHHVGGPPRWVADQQIHGTLILYNTSLGEDSTRHVKTLRHAGVIVATRSDPELSASVRFADPALHGAVVTQLGLSPWEPIRAFHLETTLLSLRAPHASITNLSGLEHATNLRELSLPDNLIESLAPIENSSSMSWLDLSDNLISDVTPLRHMTAIRRLNLSGNEIRDLSQLEPWFQSTDCSRERLHYHCIVELDLSRNAISSLTVLAQGHLRLQRLQHLDLSNNVIEDLGPLSAMSTGPNPEIPGAGLAIDLSGNKITHLSELLSLRRLVWLDVSSNRIADLPGESVLRQLGNRDNDHFPFYLDWLDLSDNLIRDISPLRAYDAIGVLSVWGNPLDTLAPLYDPDGIRVKIVYLACCHQQSDAPTESATASAFPAEEIRRVRLSTASGTAFYADPTDFLPVNFPDPDLRYIVARQLSERFFFLSQYRYRHGEAEQVYLNAPYLREEHSVITRADMARLLSLGTSAVPVGVNITITDLTGLEFAYNLRSFVAPIDSDLTAAVTDISAMAGKPHLVVLVLPGGKITDLSPIAGSTKLRWIDLSGNAIDDISPLRASTRLERIELSGNQISDISVLGHLEGEHCQFSYTDPSTRQSFGGPHQCLWYLDLSDNRISDLAPLSALAVDADDDCLVTTRNGNKLIPGWYGVFTGARRLCLSHLDLSGNEAIDVAPIDGLEGLSWLDLSRNSVRDISPLSELGANQISIPGLPAFQFLFHLDLSHNQITDAAPLTGMTLVHLDLAENLLSGRLGLDGITFDSHSRPAYLDLSGNDLSDVSVLTDAFQDASAGEPGITLRLAHNAIDDLGFLDAAAGLSYLSELDLSGNAISDIAPLQQLTTVRSLDLSDNLISDISPLSALLGDSDRSHREWLLHLNLSRNRIADLAPLFRDVSRRTLGSLDLSGNLITDLPPLTFPMASTLRLSGNRISDVGALSSVEPQGFHLLDLSYNDISDIAPLEGFEIEYLYLAGNKISDPSPLASISNKLLDLSRNQISDASLLREVRSFDVYIGGNPLEQEAIRILRDENRRLHIWLDDRDELVDIPDSALRAAIAAAVGKAPSETLKVSDLKLLGRLEAEGAGIASLVGLEFATSLSVVRLAGNSIGDLGPLGELGQRIRLGRQRGLQIDLSRNTIDDVSRLEPLLSAVADRQRRSADLGRFAFHLGLSENRIQDISALRQEGMHFSALELGSNAISDISPLVDRSVQKLDLSDNRIASLASFTESSLRPSELDLSGNRIADLSPFAVFGEHVFGLLDLSRNLIEDIEPLAELRLLRLDLSDNRISEIWPLRYLVQLVELDLSDNAIRDVSALAGLFSLDGTPRVRGGRLRLSGNRITDLSGLAEMTGLEQLDLSRNMIVDVSPLSGLFPLFTAGTWQQRTLNLSDNLIMDIAPLVDMNLGELDLSRNNIVDVGPLRTMVDRLDRMRSDKRRQQTLAVGLDGNPLSEESMRTLGTLARLGAAVFWRPESARQPEDPTMPTPDDAAPSPSQQLERSMWRGWRLELLRSLSEELDGDES